MKDSERERKAGVIQEVLPDADIYTCSGLVSVTQQHAALCKLYICLKHCGNVNLICIVHL